MKFEINLIAGIIALITLVGALTWGGHALYGAGYNARVAEESKANTAAAVQTQATAVKQNAKDTTAAIAVATHINAVHAATHNLEGSIHAPEPTPAPATRVPAALFPAGFSVCWNAASSRDPAQAAACQASREHGAVPAAATGGHRHR